MVLLRDKLIAQGEKRERSTKTCNKTMLRDKLRVFVSRISPPQRWWKNKWVSCSGMGVFEENVTNHDEIKVSFSNRCVVGQLHLCLSFPWSKHHGKNSYITWSSVVVHM